jgi:hypothetical protein
LEAKGFQLVHPENIRHRCKNDPVLVYRETVFDLVFDTHPTTHEIQQIESSRLFSELAADLLA